MSATSGTTSRLPRRALLALALCGAASCVALAGCVGDPSGQSGETRTDGPTAGEIRATETPPGGTSTTAPPTATEAPSTSSAASDDDRATATGSPPAEVDGLSAAGGVIGGTYSLTDIRVGRHDGFTRAVWEMAEAEGSPRHEVVQRVGGGEEGDGAALLEVTLSDVYAYGMTGALSADAPEDGAVVGVRPMTIESDSTLGFAVGLRWPVAAFEIRILQNPVRVILDVPDA